jgi:hypothetical protein
MARVSQLGLWANEGEQRGAVSSDTVARSFGEVDPVAGHVRQLLYFERGLNI